MNNKPLFDISIKNKNIGCTMHYKACTIDRANEITNQFSDREGFQFHIKQHVSEEERIATHIKNKKASQMLTKQLFGE